MPQAPIPLSLRHCEARVRRGFEQRLAADLSYSERIVATGFDEKNEATEDDAAIPLSSPFDFVESGKKDKYAIFIIYFYMCSADDLLCCSGAPGFVFGWVDVDAHER